MAEKSASREWQCRDCCRQRSFPGSRDELGCAWRCAARGFVVAGDVGHTPDRVPCRVECYDHRRGRLESMGTMGGIIALRVCGRDVRAEAKEGALRSGRTRKL
jgi:hypothetical protein